MAKRDQKIAVGLLIIVTLSMIHFSCANKGQGGQQSSNTSETPPTVNSPSTGSGNSQRPTNANINKGNTVTENPQTNSKIYIPPQGEGQKDAIKQEEGASVANDITGAYLSLPKGVEPASKPVAVYPTKPVEPSLSKDIVMSLKYEHDDDDQHDLRLTEDLPVNIDQRLAVFYHTIDEKDQSHYGIIPRNQLNVVGREVEFNLRGWGNYQVGLVPEPVSNEVTLPTKDPGLPVEKDFLPPIILSFNLINGAEDGYVNATEYMSPASMVQLTANGYSVVHFSAPLEGNVSCDTTQTYSDVNPPLISSLPGHDGSYMICVKLSDDAGNVTFGRSPTVVRDISIPGSINLSGYPNIVSRTTNLGISISGTSLTHYKYKVGIASSTDCASSSGYSNEIPLNLLISDDIATLSDGDIRVCVIGRDAASNWMSLNNAGFVTWIKDVTLPDSPSSLTLTPSNSAFDASYSVGGSGITSGYLIVRSTSPITWTPSQGISYATGNITPGLDIIYVGSNTFYTDRTAINGTTYYVKVFAFNSLNHYSAATSQIVSLSDPQEPLFTTAFWDNALINTTSVQLGVYGTSIVGTLDYEIQVATDTSFSTGLITNNVSGVVSGATALTSFSLINGTVYFWRARLNNGTWSGYTATRTFKVDTGANQNSWQVDSQAAFDAVFPTKVNVGSFATNSGEVYFNNPTEVTGSMTSVPLRLSDFGWDGWGMFAIDSQWVSGQYSGNNCAVQIEYSADNGSTWNLVPDNAVPYNSSGFRIHVHFTGMDSSTYSLIRLKIQFNRQSTAQVGPKLRILTMTPRSATGTLANGSFENAIGSEWNVNRIFQSGPAPSINLRYSGDPAQSGTYYARLLNNTSGALDFQRDGWIYQTFNIPVGHTKLNFYVKYVTSSFICFRGMINGNTTGMYQMCSGGIAQTQTVWVLQFLDVTAYQGQSITFTIGFVDVGQSAGNADHAGWLGVDNVYTSP